MKSLISSHVERRINNEFTPLRFILYFIFEFILSILGILFSLWSAIFSTIIYHELYILFLQKLPKCFTLGEAAIFSQGVTQLFYLSMLNVVESVKKSPINDIQIATLVIQV